MSYRVKTVPYFEKQLKQLAKKYPSLPKEYAELINELTQNPKKGKNIGKNCFKIRLAIKSKGRGKSGGARIISYVAVIEETVYLLSIYDKAEAGNIKDEQLSKLLNKIKK